MNCMVETLEDRALCSTSVADTTVTSTTTSVDTTTTATVELVITKKTDVASSPVLRELIRGD